MQIQLEKTWSYEKKKRSHSFIYLQKVSSPKTKKTLFPYYLRLSSTYYSNWPQSSWKGWRFLPGPVEKNANPGEAERYRPWGRGVEGVPPHPSPRHQSGPSAGIWQIVQRAKPAQTPSPIVENWVPYYFY